MGTELSAMASSGIAPAPECADIWQALLKNKPYNEAKLRGHVFKVNETKTAVVADFPIPKTEDKAADWDVLKTHLANLPKDICWAAYDYEYEDKSSGYNDGDSIVIKNKLCMITWAPDAAKPQRKMLAPSSSKALEAVFPGCTKNVQINDLEEAEFEAVGAKLGCN